MSENVMDPVAEVTAFLERYPETETFELFVTDANGIQRGKRIPAAMAKQAASDGIALQRSVFAADIWSEDVVESGLIFESGDADAVCRLIPGSIRRVPWLKRPAAQGFLRMEEEDGQPFFGDPREVLRRILKICQSRQLTPVVATELEFCLFDARRDRRAPPTAPRSPRTGYPLGHTQMYGISELHELDDFFRDVDDACAAQGLPTDTLISEHGQGQFEVNLLHTADALLAADHAVLLKRTVKGVAAKHGMGATFMAKPRGEDSGNGLHVHMSLLDEAGRNLFIDQGQGGDRYLEWAIGGILKHMPDTMAVLAPNMNSYKRFQAGSYAPMAASWGFDNRTLAVRVPRSSPASRRLEHRVAGADANPYLVIACVLSGALDGLSHAIDPGNPIRGNAYDHELERLPTNWREALDRFEGSLHLTEYLGQAYQTLYATCKRQELETCNRQISGFEYESYLDSV
jgi:glutamine synthetase